MNLDNREKVINLLEELKEYEDKLFSIQHTPIIRIHSQLSRSNNCPVYSWGTSGSFEGGAAPHAEALTSHAKKDLQRIVDEIKKELESL